MTKMKTIHKLEDVPAFQNDQEASDFWDHHSLAPELWADAPRGEGADPELDAILARKSGPTFSVTAKPSKPLLLDKKVRAALNRQAEQQGKTPDELANEMLKKALKVS